MSDYPNARDCKHGALRRSCDVCWLEAEVERLEAALRTIADSDYYPCDHAAIARAALGDQAAPTEPPDDLLCRPGAPCSARCERCCPPGYCQNCGKTMREHGPLANCYPAAPQVAPEPERCPTCKSPLRARLAEAERQRDAYRVNSVKWEARVATLEAALNVARYWVDNAWHGADFGGFPNRAARAKDDLSVIDAALGEQDTATEPPCEHCGSTPCCDPEPLPERTDAERLADLNALREAEGNRPLNALPPESSWADADRVTFPQAAPEPERCPADCEDGWRFNTGNAADPGEWVKCKNAWHARRPAPLDAEPERCPTCGTERRDLLGYPCSERQPHVDPWHAVRNPDE